MINLNVKTSDIARTVNADITETPAEVFARVGVDTARAQVSVNGCIIDDIDATFEDLGLTDGKTHNLRATVKMDGAAN